KLALDGGIMDKDYKRLSYILRSDEKLIESIICDYELFVLEGNTFSSARLTSHLEQRKALSEAGKRGVAVREANKLKEGGHEGGLDTPHQALKESKVKERKEINIEFKAYVNTTPDKKYRKHPLTWLNGECWKDDVIDSGSRLSLADIKDKAPGFSIEKWREIQPRMEESEFGMAINMYLYPLTARLQFFN
ncbi:MAG: hypothetical protein ACTSPI_15325, partial [Candidatus Heimdallarchaeaceae archaeon]